MLKPRYTGCVYIAINLTNGRAYIGKTVNELFNRRASHRFVSRTRSGPFYSAIRKYGWRAFLWRKLFSSDNESILFEAEKQLIVDFRAAGIALYNVGPGGEGQSMPCSDERRRKVSASMKGRTFTEEHLRNLSAAKKGRRMNQASIEKMRRTKTGKKLAPWTPERRAKMEAAWRRWRDR